MFKNVNTTLPPSSPQGPRAGKCRGWRRAGGMLAVGAFLSVCGMSMSGLAPEPEPVPRRWELQFDPGPLRIASVNVPDVGVRQYVYFTYRVTNNAGEDVFFAPSFDYSDGEGGVYRSGRDVPQAVTTRLLEVVQNRYIQDQVQIIGDILQGPAHAKDGLVIWPLVDTNPSEVVVYVTGLSGESKTIASPDGKDKFVVRKTMRMEFEAPGSLDGRGSQPLELKSRSWIMR